MSTTSSGLRLTDYIRAIPDFPKPGILFRDITPLLACAEAFRETIAQFAEHYRGAGIHVVAAAEARGFLFAAPLALELNVGFVPVRKPGKLPFDKHAFRYDLEYGTDTLEMHIDGVAAGQNVLLVDDLWQPAARCKPAAGWWSKPRKSRRLRFVIELLGLNGAARLAPHSTFSLIQYS